MSDATPAPDEITVRLPSRLELLGLLDSVTMALCERMKLDETSCSHVTMSVIEAGTNAIQHGHGRDPQKFVEIQYRIFADRMEIRVHDTGRGFDLAGVDRNATSPERLFEARGRGIYIMRACMDSVDFEFSRSGTVCTLVKRRPAAAQSA